jgi:hypothetical protein
MMKLQILHAEMDTWRPLNLDANAIIEIYHQRLIKNEKKQWHSMLERLFATVQTSAERSLASRGYRGHLHEPNSESFLSQADHLAKFDPVMLEHLRRIKDTYQGKDIRYEMIGLI